ncbi:MAG: damage-inducible protein DinB [Bacteroidetes bacterium]|nr:damage-inducible protein DinB [Bacteroidota bacterium]
MKNDNVMGEVFLKELETEASSSRKCLERIPDPQSTWKPHEKSMPMGYLSVLVAEIPKWIQATVEDGVIDFATWKHSQPKTTVELAKYFDENMKGARKALQNTSDKQLAEMFYLKNNGQTLASSRRGDSVAQSINHLVHHRGQLTVYMRLNNIAVPSIYGPSADERGF